MDDRLLDRIAEPFNVSISEEYESIEEMADAILPKVKQFSLPSLEDPESPLFKTNWILMNDTPGDNKVRMHSFDMKGEIAISIDGEMSSSYFDIVTSKRIIIGASRYRDSYLYELAFMDNDFLLLLRHGNRANIKTPYLFYCSEPIGRRLTWDEALEKLVGKYRDNQMPWLLILGVLLLVAGAIIYLS